VWSDRLTIVVDGVSFAALEEAGVDVCIGQIRDELEQGSYLYRPGRTAHEAVDRMRQAIREC
jgi:hypothetical protein